MGRSLAPVDLRVIGNVFLKISQSPWFEPGDTNSLARYLMHRYSRGQDETSLHAIAEPFAREWFHLGKGRFDVLDDAVIRGSGGICGGPHCTNRAIIPAGRV